VLQYDIPVGIETEDYNKIIKTVREYIEEGYLPNRLDIQQWAKRH